MLKPKQRRIKWCACDPATCKHGDFCPYYKPRQKIPYTNICHVDWIKNPLRWLKNNAKKKRYVNFWHTFKMSGRYLLRREN